MTLRHLLPAMLLIPGLTAGESTLNPVHPEKPSTDEALLVENGVARASIVIPAVDLPLQWTKGVYHQAAAEFAEHVRLATGATLPIVTEPDAPAGTLVLIGEGTLARQAGITASDLPLEGFRVRTWARGLAIVGRIPAANEAWAMEMGQRGTQHGVYDVLERFIGVRWYWPGEDGRSVPHLTTLRIPHVAYSDAPVRSKRHFGSWAARTWPGPTPNWDDIRFRFREGVSTPIGTACHTPQSFHIHFAEHPECFQMKADGSRDRSMPCYGNPATAALMIRDLETFYATGDTRPWVHPNGVDLWFPPNATTIYISPPDAAIDCHCAFCATAIDRDGDPLGQASRVMAAFVTTMAREIGTRWPDKQVFYLPYSNYTLPIAGSRLPGNVTSMICLMQGSANGKEPAVATAHDAMMAGWAASTGGRVHLWEYLCWPADDTTLPFQYPHVLRDFQRRHRDDLAGSYINGPAGPAELPGEHWAFQHWTLYCWFRLMWNPDFDVDAALVEFLARMYGPASEPMGRIYRSLISRWENTRWTSQPRIHQVSPRQIHEETMPRAETARLKEWLAEARTAAATGTVERRRVEFFAPALKLFFAESDRYHDGTGLAELSVLKVGGDPKIDGALDEACWRQAPRQVFKAAFADQAAPIEGTDATWIQAVWTPEAVTLAFTCEHPPRHELTVSAKARDQDGIWNDDCLELFIDPEGKRAAYQQIIVNALGTLWDGKENLPGVQTAVRREAGRWTAEIRIPFAALGKFPAVVKPQPGTIWYANFAANRPQAGKPSYQRWSSLGRANHSDFAAFGRFRFVE